MKTTFCISLLAAMLAGTGNVLSQNSYSFQTSTSTYTELSAATVVPWGSFNANDLHEITTLNGQTFYLYNTPFPFGGSKKMYIQSFGNLRIDNDTAITIIDGAFMYLDSINALSSISYKVEGTPGAYILKCQWKNLKIRYGQAINHINFQIWLYQQTGVAEIYYGPSSVNNQSGYNIQNGPQVGMFFSRLDFSRCFEKLWVNGSPSSMSLDSNKNYVFNAMLGIPTPGTVYRFVPRFSTTGMAEQSGITTLPVYPNPVNGILHLPVEDDYELYSAEGKMIKVWNEVIQIDMSAFPSGMYLLKNKQGGAARVVNHY